MFFYADGRSALEGVSSLRKGHFSEEKRGAERTRVNFDLLWRIDNPADASSAVYERKKCTHLFDISDKGMAIATDVPLAPGTPLEISFHLIYRDRQTPPMDVKGRVCYCAPTPLAGRKYYRLGVAFTQITDEARREICEFIKKRPSAPKKNEKGLPS